MSNLRSIKKFVLGHCGSFNCVVSFQCEDYAVKMVTEFDCFNTLVHDMAITSVSASSVFVGPVLTFTFKIAHV